MKKPRLRLHPDIYHPVSRTMGEGKGEGKRKLDIGGCCGFMKDYCLAEESCCRYTKLYDVSCSMLTHMQKSNWEIWKARFLGKLTWEEFLEKTQPQNVPKVQRKPRVEEIKRIRRPR